jgi:hypothetical protein
MNMTTVAGALISESERCFPLAGSSSVKSGAFVPSGSMVEGVWTIGIS